MYGAYGLQIASDRQWPGLELVGAATQDAPLVTVRAGAESDVRERFSGPREPGRTLTTADGPVQSLRGRTRDMLLDGGPLGVVHLSADGAAVTYAAQDPDAPAFARMFLDTALGTAALLAGYEALHAAAVVIDRRLVAIAAAQGAGKTSLAVAAVHAGAVLFTDDLLFLSDAGGAILAHPGPPLLNLPAGERSRGLGRVLAHLHDEQWVVVRRPATGPMPLSLIVFLERAPGAGAPHRAPEHSPAALIAQGLDSGSDPERQRRRLSLLGQLAGATPMVRLRAGTDVLAGALVEALET